MTQEFAMLHIPLRMEELGHGNNYFTPIPQHYSLVAEEVRVIDAYNEYFFLTNADLEISVNSEFGMYDLTDDTLNQQLYEHQGKIVLTNKSKNLKHVQFIQVIPKHI